MHTLTSVSLVHYEEWSGAKLTQWSYQPQDFRLKLIDCEVKTFPNKL